MEDEERIVVPIPTINHSPIMDFRYFDDEETILEEHEYRQKEWGNYSPFRRIRAVDWTPTFLAISLMGD